MAEPTRKSCFELRAALEETFMTQAILAQVCGVKQVQVWRWCEGKAAVPAYVWSILAYASGADTIQILTGDLPEWKVEPHHVFRNGKDFKARAKQFHPDVSGTDTKAEMQIVNSLRTRTARAGG